MLLQVRALTKHGHRVLVVCGRPADCKDPPKPQGATQLHEVRALSCSASMHETHYIQADVLYTEACTRQRLDHIADFQMTCSACSIFFA